MELMTSRAFLAQVEGLSPVAVMRLAARAGSTNAGVPPYSAPQHTAERDVLPAGAEQASRGSDCHGRGAGEIDHGCDMAERD